MDFQAENEGGVISGSEFCSVLRPQEFSAHLLHAADNQPKPLTKDERYQLSWEAATERWVIEYHSSNMSQKNYVGSGAGAGASSA